jgi:hypothetical protein
MPKKFRLILIAILVLASCAQKPKEGSPDQFLKSQLEPYRGAKGLVVIAYRKDCPIVQRYAQKVEILRKDLSEKGINVIYLNAADKNPDEILKAKKAYQIETTVVFDAGAKVTRALNLQRTSEAVLLDNSFKTLYQGSIDDGFDYEASRQPQKHFLGNSAEQYLKGAVVAPSYTEPRGCLIDL